MRAPGIARKFISRVFGSDGYELRIGFNDTNLIHSELSRSGHAPLLLRADDLRQVLLEQGWIELRRSRHGTLTRTRPSVNRLGSDAFPSLTSATLCGSKEHVHDRNRKDLNRDAVVSELWVLRLAPYESPNWCRSSRRDHSALLHARSGRNTLACCPQG